MNDLVAVLVLWLSMTFGLPTTSEYPEVRFTHSAELTAVRYGSQLSRVRADVVALYLDRSETILLSKGWDSSSPADVSVLVHELVHHLQKKAGRKYRCPEARERLAYAAQARWLALFGRNLKDEFRLDPMTLKLRTTCLMP